VLAGPLGLVPVGLADDRAWFDLSEMTSLASTPAGRRRLASVQLRVYAPADWKTRWPAVFQGAANGTAVAPPTASGESDLTASLLTTGLSQRTLAAALALDPSFFGKLLKGRKRWPPAVIDRARVWLGSRTVEPVPPPVLAAAPAARSSPDSGGARGPTGGPRAQLLLCAATWYAARGWSVVPIRPGTKKPYVLWKPYQAEPPTPDQLANWAELWPEAGLAACLGPVSGLLLIDVDGPEAEEALQKRLGGVPLTPTVISGSREPGRYHLYFQHPNGLQTRAKKTPWHPKLEFRGRGGLAVLPPSLHRSGNHYVWADGLAPGEIELAEVPDAVIEALRDEKNRSVTIAGIAPTVGTAAEDWVVSDSTRKFLQGEFANGPRWNDRLFQAACDLRARGIPLAQAEPELLRGAAPWTQEDRDQAVLTIRSAYSGDRSPSKW
jgi:hypothetical protein